MRARPTFAVLLLTIAVIGAAGTYRSPAEVMADAANRFLASLSDSQRTIVTFPLASEERLRWAFIPNEMWPRKGITLKAMSAAQRDRAHALLRTGLSQRGYLAATIDRGVSVRTRAMIACDVLPMCGGSPVSISYRTAPSE